VLIACADAKQTAGRHTNPQRAATPGHHLELAPGQIGESTGLGHTRRELEAIAAGARRHQQALIRVAHDGSNAKVAKTLGHRPGFEVLVAKPPHQAMAAQAQPHLTVAAHQKGGDAATGDPVCFREILPTALVPPGHPDTAAGQDTSLEVLDQWHVQALAGKPPVRWIAGFKASGFRLEHGNVHQPARPETPLSIKEPRAPHIFGGAGARIEDIHPAVLGPANRGAATEPDATQSVNVDAAEMFQ
jgi:hypothetical protein